MRAVVRSHLMAAGIQLINAANVDFASTAAFTASVVLPLGRQQAALSLPGFVYQQRDRYRHIDIRIPERPYLPINSRLQTAHPRIFACGSLVRGRNDALSLAKYETQIAVWNALFVPLKRVDDSRLTRGSDRFASAGVVPEFAKQGRPPIKAYKIWRAAVPNSAELNQVSPLPLYCQLICKHGRLQSIALVGKGAGELIEAIASHDWPTHSRAHQDISPRTPNSQQLDGRGSSRGRRGSASFWQAGFINPLAVRSVATRLGRKLVQLAAQPLGLQRCWICYGYLHRFRDLWQRPICEQS